MNLHVFDILYPFYPTGLLIYCRDTGVADKNLHSIPRCLLQIRRPETATEMVLWNPLQSQPIECG